MSHYPEHGSYTDEVLRDAGLESPEPTLSAPGSSMSEYDWSQNVYGDDVDLTYRGFTEPQGSNANQFSAVEDHTCVESPRKKRLRDSKGSDGGSEKAKGKKGKDVVLQNLILGLTPTDQYKMINHLKSDMINRQTFMEVEADVLAEIIKEVVKP